MKISAKHTYLHRGAEGAAFPGWLIAGSGPSSACADTVRPAPAPTPAPAPAHACSQHHACRKAQGGRQELGRGQLDAEDNAGACSPGGSRVGGRGGALRGVPHARRAPARRQPCAVQAGCSQTPPRTHLCRWPGRRPRPWRRPRLRGSSAGRGGVLGGHWLGAAHAAFLRAWRAANWLAGLAYTAVGHHRAVCAGPGWCVSGGWEAGCAGAQVRRCAAVDMGPNKYKDGRRCVSSSVRQSRVGHAAFLAHASAPGHCTFRRPLWRCCPTVTCSEKRTGTVSS